MSTGVVCSECGSSVSAEDRVCGVCGVPIGEPGASASSAERAGRLLAELRALTIGEYEIRGEIGRGGMAVVYLAYDLRLNRKVAIKAMLPDLAFHAGMEERFKREARTAARLDHPNIVVIYAVRDSGDPLFYVMKYVDGAPLDAVLRAHGALPIPVVQTLLQQLCAALQYAHDDGVVHRDVKPANVLVDTRGNAQVADFGIAKAADSAHLTRTGFAIGTPTYTCPEQCMGQPQTPASDQYSLGVVAYYLLTGRPPFEGNTMEVQWAHLKDPPRPVTELRPDCPPALASAVMRMLAKDPAERWPSLLDAVPYILGGLTFDPHGAQRTLMELVRTTPVTRPQFPVTPPSPPPVVRMDPVMSGENTAPGVARVDVEPSVVSVVEGESLRLTIRAYSARGKQIVDAPVTLRSEDPSVATLDASGTVTAVAAGRSTAIVRVGDAETRIIVMVTPAAKPVAAPAAVPARQPRRVPVAAVVGGIAAIALIAAAVTLARRSSGGAVDSTTSAGTVAAAAAAPAAVPAPNAATPPPLDTVVATLELSDRSPLTLEVGQTKALGARAVNRRGEALAGRGVKWESSDPKIATVGADGIINALALGRTTVTARLGDRSRALTVDVGQPVVARVIVSVPRDTLGVGESAAGLAELFDARGSVVDQPASWRSSNPAVATVDAGGVVHAVTAGSATIVATVGTIGDSTVVVVKGAPRDTTADAPRVASPSLRAIGQAQRGAAGGVTPREVGALPAGAKTPSDAEARAVADSVLTMIDRQVVRLAQLTRADSEPAANFQKFLETNDPSAKLAGAPVVSEVRSTSARVAFAVLLQWEANSAQRERTATLECVVEPVRGGWAIREVRFPAGFAP